MGFLRPVRFSGLQGIRVLKPLKYIEGEICGVPSLMEDQGRKQGRQVCRCNGHQMAAENGSAVGREDRTEKLQGQNWCAWSKRTVRGGESGKHPFRCFSLFSGLFLFNSCVSLGVCLSTCVFLCVGAQRDQKRVLNSPGSGVTAITSYPV